MESTNAGQSEFEFKYVHHTGLVEDWIVPVRDHFDAFPIEIPSLRSLTQLVINIDRGELNLKVENKAVREITKPLLGYWLAFNGENMSPNPSYLALPRNIFIPFIRGFAAAVVCKPVEVKNNTPASDVCEQKVLLQDDDDASEWNHVVVSPRSGKTIAVRTKRRYIPENHVNVSRRFSEVSSKKRSSVFPSRTNLEGRDRALSSPPFWRRVGNEKGTVEFRLSNDDIYDKIRLPKPGLDPSLVIRQTKALTPHSTNKSHTPPPPGIMNGGHHESRESSVSMPSQNDQTSVDLSSSPNSESTSASISISSTNNNAHVVVSPNSDNSSTTITSFPVSPSITPNGDIVNPTALPVPCPCASHVFLFEESRVDHAVRAFLLHAVYGIIMLERCACNDHVRVYATKRRQRPNAIHESVYYSVSFLEDIWNRKAQHSKLSTLNFEFWSDDAIQDLALGRWTGSHNHMSGNRKSLSSMTRMRSQIGRFTHSISVSIRSRSPSATPTAGRSRNTSIVASMATAPPTSTEVDVSNMDGKMVFRENVRSVESPTNRSQSVTRQPSLLAKFLKRLNSSDSIPVSQHPPSSDIVEIGLVSMRVDRPPTPKKNHITYRDRTRSHDGVVTSSISRSVTTFDKDPTASVLSTATPITTHYNLNNPNSLSTLSQHPKTISAPTVTLKRANTLTHIRCPSLPVQPLQDKEVKDNKESEDREEEPIRLIESVLNMDSILPDSSSNASGFGIPGLHLSDGLGNEEEDGDETLDDIEDAVVRTVVEAEDSQIHSKKHDREDTAIHHSNNKGILDDSDDVKALMNVSSHHNSSGCCLIC